MRKTSNRIHMLDEIRGLAVILMVVYYLVVDLTYLFPTALGAAILPCVEPFQPIIPFLFVVISGISAQLSHNSLKRGLILTASAIIITIISLLVFPKAPIFFGIIHLLAFSYMLCMLLHPFLGWVPPLPGIIGFLILFVLTFNLSDGILGIQGLFSIDVSFLQGSQVMLYPLGLLSVPLTSGDFYPIFPWLFLFLAGTYIGIYAGEGSFPAWTYKPHIRHLGFIGRHSFIFYISCQPIILGLLWLIAKIGILPANTFEQFIL